MADTSPEPLLSQTCAGALSAGARAEELPKNFDHTAVEERLYSWRGPV